MDELTRKQAQKILDIRLDSLKPVDRFAVPHKGWIRAIRDAANMTSAEMASRLGITKPAIQSLERSERLESMKLATLRRAAAALDCTLVYALVPNESIGAFATKLQESKETAKRESIAKIHTRVAQTMRLEASEDGHDRLLENE